ncbi:GCN5-related N-acetyltransferase (GNAT) [Pseudohyphozyma bogoriensis]|nr:GCN5-related N-acetyltransferase (GNAT) [Pseudohyphozyma bogoriensis]
MRFTAAFVALALTLPSFTVASTDAGSINALLERVSDRTHKSVPSNTIPDDLKRKDSAEQASADKEHSKRWVWDSVIYNDGDAGVPAPGVNTNKLGTYGVQTPSFAPPAFVPASSVAAVTTTSLPHAVAAAVVTPVASSSLSAKSGFEKVAASRLSAARSRHAAAASSASAAGTNSHNKKWIWGSVIYNDGDTVPTSANAANTPSNNGLVLPSFAPIAPAAVSSAASVVSSAASDVNSIASAASSSAAPVISSAASTVANVVNSVDSSVDSIANNAASSAASVVSVASSSVSSIAAQVSSSASSSVSSIAAQVSSSAAPVVQAVQSAAASSSTSSVLLPTAVAAAVAAVSSSSVHTTTLSPADIRAAMIQRERLALEKARSSLSAASASKAAAAAASKSSAAAAKATKGMKRERRHAKYAEQIQRPGVVDKELVAYLTSVFNDVIEEGRTYPQKEKHTEEQFSNYFFSHDCFIGLLDTTPLPEGATASADGSFERPASYSIKDVIGGRDWKECVLGMFYIKPNYPGRSSHNCNAGFVVPTHHRGLKVGMNLGRAYLHFAPLLGYKASVFNLVYVSNVASLKIWDALGFNRVGLVPEAGLLKSKVPGEEDVYTDAVVYHKTF